LDADGDVDVVLVDRAGAFHVLRNPGDGNLWPVFSQWLNLGAAALEAGALGDIDGDNDLDLMLVTWRGGMPPPPVPPDALWLNTGNGTFVDASQRLTGTPSNATDVALGDIDNDGDLDVVTTGGVLYRNTGTALVSEPFHILYNLGESHIVLAHLDGDGYLDLAAGNACRGRGCAPSGAGGWDVVHFNDGRGGFDSGTVLLQQSSMATSVAVGDVDGDGDNDVLIGHVGARGSGHDNPAENTLFLNQGDRTFRKATIDEFPFDLDATVAVILADIDGDTDIDFVACNEALSTGARRGKVHVNVLQHLWAPAFARLGRNFPLVVYGARHGAEVWASAGAVRIPVPPFGLLGLDPASLVTLKRLPGSSGPMQIDLNVPNDPALAGGVLYFQALLFGASPQAARLSNRLTHTVHPH
ncbi:MAG TPA: VCBS repeat-containing protein, partial [Planctomycetota bacterium]|nr:VCBS repeat-containing protein [Planctomycetota bacterium]